jgi:iron complex transport system substrate-binding protein
MDRDWIQKNLHSTKAVQNNHVWEIDSSIILQPGPAIFLEGIDAIANCIQSYGSTKI